MVAISEELRNLLTEESLAAIQNAAAITNGHLAPKHEVSNNAVFKSVPEDSNVVMSKSAPDTFNKELNTIKDYFTKELAKQSSYLETLTVKINDVIRNINQIEAKLVSLSKSSQGVVQKKLDAPNSSKPKNPRSVDSLPPELSIEKIFNCNGKKFDF